MDEKLLAILDDDSIVRSIEEFHEDDAAEDAEWRALIETLLADVRDRGEPPTADDLKYVLGQFAYPEEGVLLLVGLNHLGQLTPEAALAHVGEAWWNPDFPEECATQDEWRALFALAGYTVDGKRACRPSEALTLWRGSVPELRANWMWTDDRDEAERVAVGNGWGDGGEDGVVWEARVEPWRLLAKSEDEYVVDTDGLTITIA